MRSEDKAEFSKKMVEIASVCGGKAIDDVEIDAYFKRLAEYPLELVCRAFDRALNDRDHEDMFLAKTIPTDGEMQKAISTILAEERSLSGTIGCKKCKGTGLVLGERNDGSTYAERCVCLLAAIETKKKYGRKEKAK